MSYVGEGCGTVTDRERDRWVRFVREADPEHRDAAGGVAPQTIAETIAPRRHPDTIRGCLDADERVRARIGMGEHGPRHSFVPGAAAPATVTVAEPDVAVAELSLWDALEQLPAEYDRAKELTREALAHLEAER